MRCQIGGRHGHWRNVGNALTALPVRGSILTALLIRPASIASQSYPSPLACVLLQLELSNHVRQRSTLLLVSLLQAEFPHLALGNLCQFHHLALNNLRQANFLQHDSGQSPLVRISRMRSWMTSSGETFKNVKLGNLQWTEFQKLHTR